MKQIIVLYTEAGNGHKSAALALQEAILKDTSWHVKLINPFKELCAEFDYMQKWFNISSEELYNKYVSGKSVALINLLLLTLVFKIALYLNKSKIIKKLSTFWSNLQPDMIISVSPFINEIIIESSKELHKNIPCVTIITDYHECFKNIWIESREQNVICCSEKLVEQALSRGVDPKKIFKLSGMLVKSEFYQALNLSKEKLSIKLGLQQSGAIGLVMFGSYGSPDMLEIAQRMRNFHKQIQLIFVCGHNTQLQDALKSLSVDYNLVITGFIDNVQEYMRCADFCIGKPGGLSITEAAVMQLPQVLKLNIFTLLQERYNASWVVQHKIGVIVKNFHNIEKIVGQILDNKAEYRLNLEKIKNRGFYEVTGILERIFAVDSYIEHEKHENI